MRGYFFGNMYLSSIQQGIQAAHALGEMFVKYGDPVKPLNARDSQAAAMLNVWAREHKTMVLLNAGYASEIQELITFFSEKANPFPYAYFREEQAALNNSLTSVGIILPEEVYNASKTIREVPRFAESGVDPWSGYKPTLWEQELAQRLNNYGLAR